MSVCQWPVLNGHNSHLILTKLCIDIQKQIGKIEFLRVKSHSLFAIRSSNNMKQVWDKNDFGLVSGSVLPKKLWFSVRFRFYRID